MLCVRHSFSVDEVLQILVTLDSSKICEGNPDERFTSLPNIHENVMMNHSSKYTLVQGRTRLSYLQGQVWWLQLTQLALVLNPYIIVAVKYLSAHC